MREATVAPIKKKIEDVEVDEPDVRLTDWRAVCIAGLLTFLSSLEGTVVGMSEWPYMHTIDPEATSQFFGAVTSFSKAGHAIFALIFSYWSYKSQQIRWPLVAGRVIAFIACCIYLCVEFLPTGRRYLMMLCYFLFGVAGSSTCILRFYLVSVSSHADRARAFSAIVMANMLSIIIGPMVQLSFSGIKYPGVAFGSEHIRFHIYSAPIWIASMTNFVSVAIIFASLRELEKKQKTKKPSVFTLQGFKDRLHKLMAIDLQWSLIAVCWLMKIIAQLAIVTLSTTAAPLMMASFGWDGSMTVQIMAVSMGTVGLLSIGLAVAWMVGGLGKIISPRVAFLISLLISIALYVLSYPYPQIGHSMPQYNETTRSGCNPAEYSWCDTEMSTTPFIFMPVVIVVMGIGLPLASISLDTIYSKVLGHIDQSLMQGAIIVAEDLILIIGPIYSASVFTAYGQDKLWLINAVITAAGTVLWLTVFRRVKAYS